MNRRSFIGQLSAVGGTVLTTALPAFPADVTDVASRALTTGYMADVVIAGGGVGGCAAALSALRTGKTVVMTEETDWIGGQLTQQGVPPDEHSWIETHGATRLYRQYRNAVRSYYRQHYPLTKTARAQTYLNPGDGAVSRLSHEPRVSLAVLYQLLAPYLSARKMTLLLEYKITGADVQGDRVRGLSATHQQTGRVLTLTAPYFIDATELGDLLPMTNTEFVTGAEARADTRELHAPEQADPNNVQAFTMCFAMDYLPGENHVIDKPREYDFWRNYTPDLKPAWSGKLLSLSYSNPKTLTPKTLGFQPEGAKTGDALNLWNYRRIISRANFEPGVYRGDISNVNWPQNDYALGNLIGASAKEVARHVDRAKQLSLSLLYWLQTDVPRPDGGQGWPGLRLRPDVMGTIDGLAKYPYIREARRIKPIFRVLEEHVGADNRALITGQKTRNTAAPFADSVGIGYYHIDLHPSTGGTNYIDFGSLPFQIPLGALLPQRMENLLPACKNIGTTHVTNGCYRLHPVEWSIGEAVGMLVSFSLDRDVPPRAVHEKQSLLTDFPQLIRSQGIDTQWPT